MRELKAVSFADTGRKPIDRVLDLINPVLRGRAELLLRWGIPASASTSSKIGWRRRSGGIWRGLRSGRGLAGSDGGWQYLYSTLKLVRRLPGASKTAGRKSPWQDRSHKPWGEADGGAQLREICTLRSMWRGLQTWLVRGSIDRSRRASPRPDHLGGGGGMACAGEQRAGRPTSLFGDRHRDRLRTSPGVPPAAEPEQGIRWENQEKWSRYLMFHETFSSANQLRKIFLSADAVGIAVQSPTECAHTKQVGRECLAQMLPEQDIQPRRKIDGPEKPRILITSDVI